MKITSLETYFLSAPLPQTVRTSTAAISQVSEVIVKLTTDAGHVGIGEAHGPFLFQGPEGLRSVNTILQTITPLVVGRPVHALLGGALREKVPAYVTGFYYRDGEKPDDVMREAEMYVKLGYRTVKAKVGGLPPEADA